MPRLVALRVTLLLAVAAGLTACGGSAYASPSSSANPSVGAISPSSSANPSAGALPSFDLSSLGGAIPGVDSYRTSFTIGGVPQYQSVVVTKPELSKSITAFNSDGSVQNRIIVVGTKAWTADGANGAFSAIPDASASTMLAAFDPSLLLSAYGSLNWATLGSDKGLETKNGVEARHLRIDAGSAIGLAGAMPAGAAIDIWIADAGYLVAWEMSGFPTEQNVSIELTNFNDPTNTVSAPAP